MLKALETSLWKRLRGRRFFSESSSKVSKKVVPFSTKANEAFKGFAIGRIVMSIGLICMLEISTIFTLVPFDWNASSYCALPGKTLLTSSKPPLPKCLIDSCLDAWVKIGALDWALSSTMGTTQSRIGLDFELFGMSQNPRKD